MMNPSSSLQITPRHAAPNAPHFSEVSQTAFVRVGALGDLLVSLAALREAHNIFHGSQFWIIGPKLWLQILDPILWPKVNAIWVVERKSFAQKFVFKHGDWVSEGLAIPLSEVFKSCQASINLRVESYRFAWAPLLAGVRYRFGTCPPAMKWLYSHWSPWLGKDPIIHERDRMLRILEAAPTQLWKLQLTQSNRAELKAEQTGNPNKKAEKYVVHQPGQAPHTLAFQWRNQVLPQIVRANPVALRERFGIAPGKYWLVNPTASRWEKAWSKDKFREFCERAAVFAKNKGRELIVIGAPNETDWLNYVANGRLRVIQPSSIMELANVVALAELLVTNTSSVQFVAACAKTPSFVLMGRTYPARWGPLGLRDHFVAGRVPQYFNNPDIFLEDYAGYDSLTVEVVVSEFKRWVSSIEGEGHFGK